MVRLVAALVITTLVLGAAAVVALSIDPAAAAAAQVSEDSEDGDDESEVRKFAFIGVAISTVSPAEAEELDIAGAARVVEVRDGSPSAGVVQVGDIVTDVDVEQVGRPAKEWVYPFAFALLGLVIVLQLMRRRRNQAAAPGAP